MIINYVLLCTSARYEPMYFARVSKNLNYCLCYLLVYYIRQS